MKKIVLFISMISFVFSNAQTKLEKNYNNLTDNGDKLDFIFKHIINTQISDYKLLKDKLDILNTENERLELVEKESVKKDKTISDLKTVRTNLNNQITNKDLKINTIQQEKKKLKTELDDLKINRNKEKGDVETEIDFIIQQKSNSYTDKILSITKERAIKNKVNPNSIAVLENYISMRKELVAAKNLLNNPYNKTNIDKKINNLDNLNINRKFSGLIKEKKVITNLLYNYETMCNTLSKLILNTLKGANKNTLKQFLPDEKEKYKDYPYLANIIKQKLNNERTSKFGCN